MHLDPTMDDVKKLAVSSRRAAKVFIQLLLVAACKGALCMWLLAQNSMSEFAVTERPCLLCRSYYWDVDRVIIVTASYTITGLSAGATFVSISCTYGQVY